jgi:hypothetical protein
VVHYQNVAIVNILTGMPAGNASLFLMYVVSELFHTVYEYTHRNASWHLEKSASMNDRVSGSVRTTLHAYPRNMNVTQVAALVTIIISTILVLVPVGYVGNGASKAEDNGVGWCYEKSELTTATAVGAVGAIGNAIACVLFLIGGRAQTAATSGV